MKYWMITNRNVEAKKLGQQRAELTFWGADSVPLDALSTWHPMPSGDFKRALIGAADQFPGLDELKEGQDQRHVSLFVHGYNNDWKDAARRYTTVCRDMFEGNTGLGICVLFSWPSNGYVTDYLADRADASESGLDLAEVLCELYDWLLLKQKECVGAPDTACKAKTSIIAHSMGNYVFQKAMQACWTRKNRPLLVSLITQALMVAADVDNDLFKCGEANDNSDGDAMANLTYRITALYNRRDDVLGCSAGLKHFGKRRLGRTGLDRTQPLPDNVWDVDCTSLVPPELGDPHGDYFKVGKAHVVTKLMQDLLRGIDREIITQRYLTSKPTRNGK